MFNRRIAHWSIATILSLGVLVIVALAGPLDPPPGPVTSTGTTLSEIDDSLAQIKDAVVSPLLAPNVGYEVAGISPGAVTSSLQTIVSGRSGVIKRIVTASELSVTAQGIELWVDGRFAGVYRPVIISSIGGGVDHPPLYDVNIKFTNLVQAKVRVFNGNDGHSISVHYLPTS